MTLLRRIADRIRRRAEDREGWDDWPPALAGCGWCQAEGYACPVHREPRYDA